MQGDHRMPYFMLLKAEARESICFNLWAGSFVETNGNNFLFYLCTTKGHERFHTALAWETFTTFGITQEKEETTTICSYKRSYPGK